MQNHDAQQMPAKPPTGRGGMRSPRGVARLAFLFMLPLLLGAAGDAPTDVVAQQGAVKFTVADIRAMIDHTDPATQAQVLSTPDSLANFVRDRLLRQTLLNAALAAKWEENPEVVARIADARDGVIAQTYLSSRTPPDPNFPTQAEIASAYEANKARFAVPKQYHIAQIAILVPAGASKEVDDAARRKAQDLRQQAVKPKADFADLAKKNSQDRASADHGGDLGWVRDDQLVPGVRDAIAKLTPNGISDPVRSAEAWHVIKLFEVRPASVMPLEQVRDSLVQAMRQSHAQQAARAYIDELVREYPIQLDEIDLGHRVSAAH